MVKITFDTTSPLSKVEVAVGTMVGLLACMTADERAEFMLSLVRRIKAEDASLLKALKEAGD
jgi:hypothetical protein